MKKISLFILFLLMAFSLFGATYEKKSPSSKKQRNDNSTSVIIKSNVSGAEVYLNNNYQGKTDLTLNGLAPGYYNIEVSKDGYDIARARIQVKKGYTFTYSFTLRKQVGYLDIVSLPGNTYVYVDGSKKTSFPVELDAGSHQVRIKRFGYEEKKFYVDIVNKRTVVVTPTFEVAPFRVTDFNISKKAINPNYSNGLGTALISFEVSNNGQAHIEICDEFDNVVWYKDFTSFSTWEQSVKWSGTDNFDEILSDGKYYVRLTADNDYQFDGEIILDSKLTYPVVCYTPSGSGIGTLPALLDITKSYVMPFIQAEGVFLAQGENQGFYGVPVTAGVICNIFDCLDLGIAGGGVVGIEGTGSKAPYNVSAHAKAYFENDVNKMLSLKYGVLFRYGFAGMNLFPPYVFDKGNGMTLGFLGGMETEHFYGGLNTEYIWGAETGNISTESQLWKNGITLAVKPKQWIRLGTWCALHCISLPAKENRTSNNSTLILNAIDTGVEYAMVPKISALSFNIKAKALIFMDNTTYISGSFGLSYLF